MSLNQWMHPRNPYKTPPDFKQLAIAFPEFRKHVTQDITGRVHLDFNEPASLACLATTLFKKDFNIDVLVPATGLIPTLPSRLNYLLWVEDLLALLPEVPSPITGLDLGCGATAVYPLLAAKHLGWNMLGTEASKDSLQTAQENVSRNGLQDKVKLVGVTSDQILKSVLDTPQTKETKFEFSMCNPPFYNRGKVFPPGERLPGKQEEVSVEGGEVAFASRMLEESKDIGSRVRLYTVLLGHKASVAKEAPQF